MSDLFGAEAPQHDPRGKVRFAKQAYVIGGAVFSDCRKHRFLLTRSWGESDAPFALWIGMNPSTADAGADDPTVRREVNYTRDRLGLTHYVKCNVMSYRATYPEDLLPLLWENRSPLRNVTGIMILAKHAKVIVAAWGALPASLVKHAEEAETAIQHATRTPLHCVGYTKNGSPRHPLYIKKDAPLLPYPKPNAGVAPQPRNQCRNRVVRHRLLRPDDGHRVVIGDDMRRPAYQQFEQSMLFWGGFDRVPDGRKLRSLSRAKLAVFFAKLGNDVACILAKPASACARLSSV